MVSGAVIKQKIVAADRERFTSQIGEATGQARVSFSMLAPAALVDISLSMVPKFPDPDDSIRRAKSRVFFAYVIGDLTAAKASADLIQEQEFRDLWERALARE
jgi:hypothetical protein